MNERIQELARQAFINAGYDTKDELFDILFKQGTEFHEKFAELIVKDCMIISKTWEDQLEKSKQLSESNAVGIVTYRISRQFGVEE